MKRQFGLVIWSLMLILGLVSCIGEIFEKLDGTSWRLVSYGGQAVIPGSSPTLSFDHGKIGGNAGCNSFGGVYQQSGDRLEIGETFSTLMACLDDGITKQEQAYLQMLSESQRFELIGGQLSIITKSGEKLVFDPNN